MEPMHVHFSLMAKLREQKPIEQTKEIKQDKNTLQGSNNSETIRVQLGGTYRGAVSDQCYCDKQ